jgi:hypothetical protein
VCLNFTGVAPSDATVASNGSSTGSTSASRQLSRLNIVKDRVDGVLFAKKKLRESLAYLNKEQEARAQLLLKHTIDITKEPLLTMNVDPFVVHGTSSVDQV